MPTRISPTLPLLLFFVFAFCLSNNGVHAFGAGNIPSYAFVEGTAFRHGDIEDTLADLVMKGAGGFALSSLIGKGPKFGGLDIKRIYFGNWLRDYSQAVDIGTLKKVNLQTILNLVMMLGFMANGYATGEFEVTPERLGAYLPTEHIDNPKGYGEGEDARQYDPRLRGPVHPDELAIDPQTGMKNYIANENGHWDTSKSLVRRVLQECISLGRKYKKSGDKADQYEAFRLLGQALHTLEDFSAHSNFCELALVSLGYNDVFVHVGDAVRVRALNGKMVAPLVTGTFGGSDFMHSLLGEATDHISEASVTDLNKEFDRARSQSTSSTDMLRDAFVKLPGGSGDKMERDMEGIERLRAGVGQGGKQPQDMSPQEMHAVLWQVLSFRDSVMKSIAGTIEKIPGLGPLVEKIQDSISVFVFTTLEPFLKPLLATATSSLQIASSEVISGHDQYEVFNDPYASDPTHSFLSKDHFNLILNEPAGNLAKIVLTHTVNLVTKAWADSSVNVNEVTDEALQCLFHPDFYQRSSAIQREMLDYMKSWVQGLGHGQRAILARLSKESVRAQENTRASGAPASHAHSTQVQQSIQGFMQGVPGVTQMQGLMNLTGGTGIGREASSEQSSAYYSRLETSGSMYSTSPSYAPPSGPPPPASAYAPSSPYGQPPQSGPPYPHHAQSQHTSSYAQPPSTAAFPGTPSYAQPPSTASFPSTSSPYQQSAPGRYAPSVPSPSVPSPSVPSPSIQHAGGYSAAGYSSLHGPSQSSYSPQGGPPLGDFGGFPDERQAMHGHGPGYGHGHDYARGPGFPEERESGGRPGPGPPPFPDDSNRFGDQRQSFPGGRGGYFPQGDPYERRW